MVYSDQDELEKLKEWWKNYGGALVLGVVLGLALLFGNKYWQEYREKQRMEASELYAEMLEQAQGAKRDAARASGSRLLAEYARTPYAGMAALLLARLSVEANDMAAARGHLEWAIANADDPAVVHTARLRLGQLHVASGEYEAALALANAAKEAPGFEAEYLELKGDAYAGMRRIAEARAAYREALEKLAPQSAGRQLLEMKLDDLGGAEAG
ncbi:MAG TPA: tetratricopeptide repeat protein [Burkholderiales bacterium]